MTSPEAPDWTTPVQVANDSIPLVGSPATLPVSGGAVVFDVSAFNSVMLQIPLPAGAAGFRYSLSIEWFTPTSSVRNDVITFHSAGSYLNPPLTLLVVEMPVSGTQMRLSIETVSAVPLLLTLNGSRQVVPRMHISRDVHSGAQMVSLINTTNINPSASMPTVYVPPVDRAVRLVFTAPAADVDFILSALTELSGSLLRFTIGIWTPNANTITVPELLVPGTGLELLVTNRNTTTVRAVSGNIFDVS